MGLLFKKEHINKILEGTKTQTRRRHKRPLKVGRVYDVNKDWYHSTDIKIRIVKAYIQRLGDITPDEAFKEGGYTIEEFISVWKRINISWDPDEEVVVYEFRLLPDRPGDRPRGLRDFLEEDPPE
jgi:hypothetical protein